MLNVKLFKESKIVHTIQQRFIFTHPKMTNLYAIVIIENAFLTKQKEYNN